ncbi:MAG: cation transporter [Syntrophorhabdus aromaticivorans]|uniref:Cation transporter n=1 Tax=Syntrophorhabdus aromaticivorans TaxID=328301 RepID=A0A971M355_9BACT|nr:cation transporter [Syntrophorhabdus aromaticivorans]
MKNADQGMMLAVRVSLVCNAILFTIKGITLVVVNSLAVAADLGISFVALGISILLYYAIKMSNRPADVFHNYGYGKIENVAEAIEGVILIGLALAMSFQAILHLIRVGEVSSPIIGFICSFLGIAINFWGANFILKLAEKHASPALRAEGIHFRLEGFISLAITLSFALVIVLHRVGLFTPAKYVDPVATLIVSAFITFPSVRLLREAFMKLLDASIGESGQMDVIKALARHFDSYCNFKEVRTRTAGRKQFVDIHLVVPAHSSVKNAHTISAALKHEIASTLSDSEVTVHMEPCTGSCAYARNGRPCPYMQEREFKETGAMSGDRLKS